MEALSGFDRVLTGEAVGDEQHFVRLGDAGDRGRLGHQLFVDRRAAGGIEDEDVVAGLARRRQRALGDVLRALARDDRQNVYADGFAERGQLLHRRRAARVERGHQHALLLGLGQTQRDFGGGGGFARALKAGHHDDVRRLAIDAQRLGRAVAAERIDQHIIDDLDDLLARLHRLDDVLANRLNADFGDEILDHRQGDVGLQQRHADFAQRRIDIALAERAAPSELV